MSIYSVYDLDEKRATKDIKEIGNAQLDLLNAHLDNQLRLRETLTESQFEALRDRVKERTNPEPMGGLGLRPGPKPVGKYKAIFAATNAKRKVIEIQLIELTKGLLNMYSKYKLDGKDAQATIGLIHKQQIALSALNHQQQLMIRNKLTAEEFKELVAKMQPKRNRPAE